MKITNYTPSYAITSKILKLSTTIVADKTIKRDISKLKEQNRLTRVGSQKSGYWKVNHK